MKIFAVLSLVSLALVSGNCRSAARSRAQVCATDADCGRARCDLGRCVSNTIDPTDLAPASSAPRGDASSFALRGTALHESFRVALGARVSASPRLLPSGDFVLVTESGRVVRMSPDGRIVRERRLERRVLATPAVDVAGRVYVGAEDGRVVIVDSELQVLHELSLGDPIVGELASFSNGLVAVPSRGVALLSANGVVVRRIPSPSVIRGGAVRHRAGYVVFGTSEGRLVAARMDGAIAFDVGVGASVEGPPGLDPDGSIWVGTDLGELVHVAPDGVILGRFRAERDVRAAPVLAPNGTRISVDFGGVVRGFDASLTERFTTSLGGEIHAAPLIDHSGHIVFGTTLGRLHILSPDGHELAMIAIGAGVVTTPLLTPDATLIVVANDGTVRGLR